MGLNIGVLLLYCKEGRQTHFTQAWADLAMQRVAAYLFAQSGGRESITYRVFDWQPLDMYEADWVALGMGAYNTLKPTLEQALGASLDPFTHILIGIDTPNSSGGTTPGAFTYLAARNFMPPLISHELGHRYGANDAFRETSQGTVIYENHFCVMGAKGWPASFTDDILTDAAAPGLNRSGPNMSAPTLMATGWLNEAGHGLENEISRSGMAANSGSVVELAALEGAPGMAWGRPPLVARYEDLLIEYRIADPAGWDRGLPDPGDGAGGWVVVHRSPKGAPVATFVNAVEAKPGAMLVLGKDDPLDIFNPGPLKFSVLSFDPGARTVRLFFSMREARQPPSSRGFGGVYVGGGGLVWTPGRGVHPVPPHSPLVSVLDKVAQVHALQETMAAASESEMSALKEATTVALQSLQQTVNELQPEPLVSPLAQAAQYLNDIKDAMEHLSEAAANQDLPREMIEVSRQRLDQVQQLLANVGREEVSG